jgi:radical SAM superfamily enzyme YgiQ (UPF0313 family)
MINILLIDCSRALEPELRDVYDVHHPPVGLLALATHIEKSDLGQYTNCKIIDNTIDYTTHEELEQIIFDTAPDIVGLRCLHKYTDQFHRASAASKQLPNQPLVIGGGPYPSAAPQQTMEVDECLDIVVVGEGEAVFYDLISAYLNKEPLTDVPGIYYRKNGEVKQSKARDVIQDLDSIPFPDWPKIKFDRYSNIMGQAPVLRKVAPILTTRGCPYACTYCHDLFQKRFRVRSAEHIVAELEVLHDMGVHDISVIDDIFNLYPKRVIDIFNLIIQKNLKLRFYYSNGLRGDRMTHEVIDAMVDGGSILFTYALESGSRRIQKLVKKALRFEPFYNAVDYTVKKGVMVDIFMMVGFPTETEEEAFKTLEFLMQWDEICFPYLNELNAFPGTEIYNQMIKQGMSDKSIKEAWASGYSSRGKEIVKLARYYFLKNYFLRRDRLKKAIAIQRKFLRDEEILYKYKTYLPGDHDKYQTLDELFDGIALNTEKPTKIWKPETNEELARAAM